MRIFFLLLTDPGTITFEERGILVKESVGVAQVPVLRKNGADGEVSVHWRTIGEQLDDFVIERELAFKNSSIKP